MMNKKEIFEIYKPYMANVKEICTPFLEQYNLTHFWYSRAYPNRTFIELGLDPKWFLYCLKNNFFVFWSDIRFHPSSWPVDQVNLILIPNNFAHYLNPRELELMTKKYQIYYSFNILINRGIYLENFGFSASSENYNSISIYSKYFGILKAFGKYFTHKAENIIKDIEQKGRLEFPSHVCEIFHDESLSNQEFYNNNCNWSNTNLKNYYISTPRGDIEISSRQRDCLSLMAQGKSNKEIAFILGIEIKTVDSHTLRLKDKTGLLSRSQLVEAFLKSGL